MAHRTARNFALALFTALCIGLSWLLLPHTSGPAHRLSLGLAYASLALLLLTLAIGPWTALRGRRVPVSTMLRRDAGIWCAIAGLLHVVFGLQVHMGGDILRYFFLPLDQSGAKAFLLSNWTGLFATIILIGLLALSNNLMLRQLGTSKWKFWQRFNYALASLTAIHAALYMDVEQRNVVLIAFSVIAALTVLTLQVIGFARVRQSAAGQRGSPSLVGGSAEGMELDSRG